MVFKLFRRLFEPAPLDPLFDLLIALDELKAMVAEKADGSPPPASPIGVIAAARAEKAADQSREEGRGERAQHRKAAAKPKPK